MYTIQTFNVEAEQWETVRETADSVRIISDRYATKTVFETDDPEWNG